MSAFPPPPDSDRDPSAEPPPLGMAVCEVTGKTVPEDETVVFQGRRVSAEGKRVLVDRLTAGEPMPGELEDASRWARLGGAIIDTLFFMVLLVIAYVVSEDLTLDPVAAEELPSLRAGAVAGSIFGVLGLLYYAVFHASRGQTPGKMLLRTRVVMVDGGQVTTRAAWLRALVHVGPELLGSLAVLVAAFAAVATVGVAGWIEIATILFGFVNVLLIFRASKKCLHDDLAGTRVVTTRV